MHCNNSYNPSRNQANQMMNNNKNQTMAYPEQKPTGYSQPTGYGQQPVYSTPVGFVQPTPYAQAMNFNPNMGLTQQMGQYYSQPTMEIPAQYTSPIVTSAPMEGGIIPETTGLPPGTSPVDFEQLLQTPVFDIEYTQGYLRTQIGRKVKVEFLIGTNMFIDREGTLMDVGISYIIIQETETDDLLLCDIYSIKFVRFYY